MPRSGRPEPESFKAVDTPIHTAQIVPVVPLYVPGCIKTVHMRDGSSSSYLLNVNE